MKKILLFLLVNVFVIILCKGQSPSVNIKDSDILLFSINIKNELINSRIIHNEHGHSLIKRIRARYNYEKYARITIIEFVSYEDTMNIKCFCPQYRNYYFKNLEFKKGNYELKFNIQNNTISGSQIQASDMIRNILFKNTYVNTPNEPFQIFQDKYFKELEFYKIDMNDTINVKLKKIDELN